MSEAQGEAGKDEQHWSGEAPKTIDVTPQEEPPRAAHGRRLWPVLILAVLVVAVLGTSPYWTHLLPWSRQKAIEANLKQLDAQDQRLTALTQQQAALEQRLAQLAQQLKSAAAPDARQQETATLHQLADRVVALERRPAGVDETQLAAVAAALQKLQAATTQLDQRLDKLEARGEQQAGSRNDQALLLALGQLRDAVARGRGFAVELDTMNRLGGNRPELAAPLKALEPAAKTGIPAMTSLTQSFRQSVAPALLRVPPPEAGDSLGQRVLAKLRALVVIRRVGDNAASGDPVEAAVAKTEAALTGNDLAGAVAALEALPETQRTPAREWLAEAHRRLDAEAALDALNRSLAEQLTAAPAAAAPAPAAAQPAPSR